MAKSKDDKSASQGRAVPGRSSYIQAQVPEREPAERAREPRPGGRLRAPLSEELVWARVLRPNTPLVYLDLNHYIYLAQSAKGSISARAAERVQPGYSDLAAAARDAKASGRAIFPLSSIHLMELSKVKNPRQRADVAATMEELSGFNYLLGRSALTRLELDAGLDWLYGEEQGLGEYVPLIGSSFAHGFGHSIDLKISGAQGQDPSYGSGDQAGAGALAELITDINLEMERAILRGPSDEEIPDLHVLGWDADSFRRGQESRMGFELETNQVLLANSEWLRGRLRDVVSGREVVHEWLNLFVKHLVERDEGGRPHKLPSDSEMTSLWAAMPQVQVAVSIKTRYHRNLMRKWKTNDIADIDAMSIAYPYCDAVFTDKDVRAALVDDRELRRIRTFMPRRPEELTDWLVALPAAPEPAALVPHSEWWERRKLNRPGSGGGSESTGG